MADAFGGYDGIYAGSDGQIIEVVCWAHARRKFHEAQRTAGRVAHEALARIGQLNAIERELNESCAGTGSELALDERIRSDRVGATTARGAAVDGATHVARRTASSGLPQEPDRPGDRVRTLELGCARA
ncbi:MAG: IS66 family transposase [Pirellulales bacterium]|nr:IS66 family transposase [Pirellulales bacterium]